MRTKQRTYTPEEIGRAVLQMYRSQIVETTLDALETMLDRYYDSRPTKHEPDKSRQHLSQWDDPNDGISTPPTFA